MKRSAALKRGKPLQRKARLKARKVPKAFRQRRDAVYAAWIRMQPCLCAGRFWKPAPTALAIGHSCWLPVECCHVRSRGAGGDDRVNTVPMCRVAHASQHELGIRSFQARWGIDLKAEAERLYQQYLKEICGELNGS